MTHGQVVTGFKLGTALLLTPTNKKKLLSMDLHGIKAYNAQ